VSLPLVSLLNKTSTKTIESLDTIYNFN